MTALEAGAVGYLSLSVNMHALLQKWLSCSVLMAQGGLGGNEGMAGQQWLGWDWGIQGGRIARELALWVNLQRECWRRGLLLKDAVARLTLIGFQWQPQVTWPFSEGRVGLTSTGSVIELLDQAPSLIPPNINRMVPGLRLHVTASSSAHIVQDDGNCQSLLNSDHVLRLLFG